MNGAKPRGRRTDAGRNGTVDEGSCTAEWGTEGESRMLEVLHDFPEG